MSQFTRVVTGDATTQRAIQELQDEVTRLRGELSKAKAGGASDADVAALRAEVQRRLRKPNTLDFNDVFRPAGETHAIGYVPDPGPYANAGGVLHADGTFKPALDGIVQTLLGGEGGTSLAQDRVNVLGALAVLSGMSADSVNTRLLSVLDHAESLEIKYTDTDQRGLIITAPGGGTVLQPNQITGLQGWWKADAGVYSDAGVTLAVDGNTVQQWNDSSGNSRNLSQATAGSRPTYKTSIVNGLPVVRFGGATDDDRMTGAAMSNFFASQGKTIFVVYKRTANVGGALVGDEGENSVLVQYGSSGTTANNFHKDSGGFDGPQTTAANAGSFNIMTYMHDTSNFYTGVNDTRTASLTSTASGASNSLAGALNIGDRSTTSHNFLDGDIAEITFYNVALSEASRQQIETYLATKYAVSIPYSIIPYSNTDVLLIRDASGREVFRIDSIGQVYVRGTLVH